MKIAQNMTIGFGISFIGALPLGYLNLFGFDIYSSAGFLAFLNFLLGVVTVEMLVVAATLKGAMWLLSHKKLVLVMEILSIVFLLLFAASFLYKSNSTTSLFSYKQNSIHPYFLGLSLSAVNFFQISFWAGWNLVVVQTKKISTKNALPYFYVLGTGLGTIGGIMAFVFGFDFIFGKTSASVQWLNVVFPILFIVLASIQLYKLYIKFDNNKSSPLHSSS